MELGIFTTARCNASCLHCSTSCGPDKSESLPREQIFSLMDQAHELTGSERLEFYLTGGEPFLDFDLLLDVITYGKSLGAVMTCVTNGYWASSNEKSRNILSSIKDAGLDELSVSSSRFHEAFISRQRLQRVLAGCRELGIPCTVKRVSSQSDRTSSDSFSVWAKHEGAKTVQDLSLMPHLRDHVTMDESEFEREQGLPAGSCPSRILTVRESGKAYTCCTPGGFNEFLELGDISELGLSTVQDKFLLGATQQILREHGPGYFVDGVRKAGLEGRLRTNYGGICDLCTHITADEDMRQVAQQMVKDFEVQRLSALLASITEPTAARSSLTNDHEEEA